MKQKVPLSEGLATRVKTTKALLEINDTVSKNLSEEKKRKVVVRELKKFRFNGCFDQVITETHWKLDCEFHLSNFNRILPPVMNRPRQKRKVLCRNICGSRPFANTSCATKTF